jgi:putative peptidoglycan lipid II flippase
MRSMDAKTHDEQEHFFSAAKVVAGLTMLSRVLGLVRDMVIVPLGGPVLADRFWTAFAIPNLFRRLFGEGALSAAFVPVFTDVDEAGDAGRSRAVLANVGGLLAVILAALTVLIWAGLIAWWLIARSDAATDFLIGMTGLMLPFMFTVCLLALGSAALNCRGHFWYPAAAPILLNVVLIFAAGWLAPKVAPSDAGQFVVIAVALLSAGTLQLLGVVWLLRRGGLALFGKPWPVLRETRRIAKLMGPMFLPLSVMQFSAFGDKIIALAFTRSDANPNFPLDPGIVRCLYAASRMYMLPLGVLAIPIATVVFPLFSRYAARNDTLALRQTTNRALRLCLFFGIPAGVGLAMVAQPAIRVIFQRGDFRAADTIRTAWVLRAYCLGMWAYFCNHILLRAFFSDRETRRPLVLSMTMSALNIGLVLGLIWTPMKGAAVGVATATTSSISSLVLVWLLRRRWGRLGFRRILASGLRIAVASGLMAAVVWACVTYLPGLFAPWVSRPRIPAILIGIVVGAGVYLLAAIILRSPELGELRKRRAPAEEPPPAARP